MLMREEAIYIPRRKRLVEELAQKGITDKMTLDAISRVPRQYFVDITFANMAYEDKALPIGHGQTISQPFTVAKQTENLRLKGGEKVLEIGTGSGYQAAVLAECGVELFSIERQAPLYAATKKKLTNLGYTIRCVLGDGFEGLPNHAPFDRIIVTAGAAELPEKLLRQLKIGGLMILPFGSGKNLEMYRIERVSDVDFKSEKLGPCAFVPMLKGINH